MERKVTGFHQDEGRALVRPPYSCVLRYGRPRWLRIQRLGWLRIETSEYRTDTRPRIAVIPGHRAGYSPTSTASEMAIRDEVLSGW